ncbi:MAG: hypothetical protein ABWX65_06320 [Mycetocola sp.]
MVSGSPHALDAGDGTPESHATASHTPPDRLDYDEFSLDYDGTAGAIDSSFSTDDIDI